MFDTRLGMGAFWGWRHSPLPGQGFGQRLTFGLIRTVGHGGRALRPTPIGRTP
jgi:hypothetical protein